MRCIAVILSACLLNCALALPALSVEEHVTFVDPTEDRIQNPSPLEREIKLDGSADWSRVVGGSTASSGQFPYIVSLRRSYSHFCGGVIVSAVYILTAAHCTIGASASSITAVVGTNTLNQGGSGYGLSRIVVHSGYNGNTMVNDISLLRTSNSISGSSYVNSIPISSASLGAGATVTLSGWGNTFAGGSLPNNLQYINLQTISSTECAQRLSPNPVYTTSLCTYTKTGQGACNGDSGGPLAYNGVLVGLVSWGQPCAVGYPDVFTRVSSYIDWIQSNAA